MKCPNKTHPDWEKLVEEYGEYGATALYVKNNYNIPNNEELENIRQEFFNKKDLDNKQLLQTNNQRLDELKNTSTSISSTIYELMPNISEQNPTFYQNNTNQSTEEYIASEKTIRDLATRMSDRIGIPVRFESDRTKRYKGKLENGTAVINLAYATLDTSIHEILAHPIIRAIKKGNTQSFAEWVFNNNPEFFEKYPFIGAERIINEKLSKEEKEKILKQFKKETTGNTKLYNSLLKELETGRGKEVFEQVKRGYIEKPKISIQNKNQYKYQDITINGIETSTFNNFTFEFKNKEYYVTRNGSFMENTPEGAVTVEEISDELKQKAQESWNTVNDIIKNGVPQGNYTLEEQQEEAIVTLLGMMAAEKLDKVKDGKLISLLKRLLKEMKAFMKQLLGQKEVEIDKLPDNMTLGDIADLLAYSNSKLILPGNEVVYTTPDNQQFKTYAEASNHISELARSVEDVDLSDVKVNLLKTAKTIEDVPDIFIIDKIGLGFKKEGDTWYYTNKDGSFKTLHKGTTTKVKVRDTNAVINAYNQYIEKQVNTIKQFIEKNKQYEQSKEIIEEWKKVNNIQYNPEEVYSRGQEFVSVVGAYSDFDVDLMMQNLLQHIEDNQKAGGEFTISAFTKPVDRKIGHLEGGGGKIKFKIYPQSQDIKWAANADVYSGSVWDASEKVNKDKKSELLGVSYTKYPSLQNVNAIQPNLAAIIDNLAHHHNELGISLTGDNFRLEYDADIPYQTKKIIDSINSILDQKYGKLVKPEIKQKEFGTKYIAKEESAYGDFKTIIFNTEKEALDYKKSMEQFDDVVVRISKQAGKQPTQTKGNTTSIESVRDRIVKDYTDFKDLETGNSLVFKEDGFENNKVGDTIRYNNNEYIIVGEVKENPEFPSQWELKLKEKEYTSQALINLKVTALKEVARKYPRSLIRSEVRPYKSTNQKQDLFDVDELLFQLVGDKIVIPKGQYKIEQVIDGVDTEITQQEIDKQVFNDINKAIESQLEKLGIGIGILNEFEQKRDGKTIEGEFDPSSKRKTAEGLSELIRIAQGERGQEALPEEFAHFVDYALRSNGNPLYHRLTNLISDMKHIEYILEQDEEGSFETYRELYGDDTEALAAEARAKLLKKHILNGEAIQESPWARLMRRIKSIFNNIFNKGDANELIDKINEAEKAFSSFAVALMNEEIDLTFDLNSAPRQRVLYKAKESIRKEVTNADRALRKIIEIEHKRLRILEATEGTEESDTLLQDSKLLELEVARNKKEFDKGILIFLDGIVDNIEEVFNNIPTRSDREENFRSAARYLRDVKGLINAYKPLMEELIDYTLSDEYKESGLDIKETLRNITGLLVAGEREYKRSAEPMFLSFLRQFTQDLEGRTIKGKKVDKQYLQDLLTESTRDISFMDRWLFSMGESSNLLLRLIEAPVKNAKFNAREQSNETARQIQFAQEKLEKAGYKTDFMYERDEKGKLTGYYIREVDYKRFSEDRDAIEKRLIKKYKRDKNQAYWKEYHNELEKIATKEDGKYVPNKEIYGNKAFENLAPAQREYYDFIIETKQRLDKLLPDNRVSLFLTPQMRKDFLERVKQAGSLRNAMKLLGSGIKDSFIARESDDEFGIKVGIQNFDNTNLEILPVYYTNKIDNMENLSTDTGSSLIMYADMAYQYNALEEIVDMMEIGKDILKKKDISETRSNKDLVEIIQRKGRTIKNKTLKREGSSYFMDKIEDFYSAQLYGKVVKDEGSIGKLSIAKGAGFINKATALNTYAVNLLSATANVGIGKLMTRIEAVSREYFDYKDLIKADSIYSGNVLSVLGQAGRSRKTNKMDLMGIKFNVMQDHESAIRGLELNRQNFFSRQINWGALFFMNNAGEHFMQNRVFLALAVRFKLKDAQGNEINLWDAHEVVKGSDGIERVQLKKGVTKMDGSAFTSRDVEQISRRSARINQKIQGIYNTEDMNAFQRLAIGRLAMMFRKWIPPSWNRRFQGEYYNFDLGDTEQGFYNSFYFDFLKTLAQDLKSFEFNWRTRYNELTPKQQQNARRVATELGQFLAIVFSYLVLSGMWDDDDEWYKHYVLYSMRRLQAEAGTQIPGPTMIMEGFNLLQSPAAGLHYTQNLFRAINIINWTKPPIQSGDYKGWNKGAKHLWQAMPLVKPIERARDPKQVIQFYNNVW